MISIWNGGLAIYGAVIAGAITIFIVCKIKKLNPIKMLDATAPAVMIGQIIGRWGNFCNGEAFGEELVEGNWLYFIRMGLNSGNTGYTTMMVHPTFLYESLWNLVGYAIIHFLYKKKKFDGQVVLMYVTWYGFGRMLIEGLRTDSLYIGVFRISQVVGFFWFVLGAIALTVLLFKAHRRELDAEDYQLAYKKVSRPQSFFEENSNTDTDTVPENKETENTDTSSEE
jgi:phosphatidylglycerol:prolipoprotein diacylglycerol transferase